MSYLFRMICCSFAVAAEPNISSCEKSIARLQDQLENAKVEAEKPWPQEDEYQIKTARLNELNFLLSKKDAQPEAVL